MFRLCVFSNGGFIEYDKNPQNVPLNVINELIIKECISNTKFDTKAPLRLGKNHEYTGSLLRDPLTAINAAILYPAVLQMEKPDNIVADVLKIYVNTNEDLDKMSKLIDLRLQQCHIEEPAEEPTVEPQEQPSDDKKPKNSKKKSKKKSRRWDDDGFSSDSDLDPTLDFSTTNSKSGSQSASKSQLDDNFDANISSSDLGQDSKQGFLVKELSSELGDILNQEDEGGSNEQFGFLKKIVGGKKLDEKALRSSLDAMEDHLVAKNVAKDVASAICDQVSKDLVGTSTKNWTTVKTTVKTSVSNTLRKILTPATSTDLLADVKRRQKEQKPYVISVVGVNGVGKSTNLGKLAFWFLQNDFKILIAACDTFRSGAVEQLRVHVNRLAKLKGTRGEIELFDQGYGKDAAVIAKKAVEYATKNHFDVVLIDTAGRRHNDDRLMANLEKFGNQANPDKIIMVGEALVGTDSVDQARNFDAAFGKNRGLDFFLISKCDTVGELLGALVNVTYATGVPVLFVGVGQQYTDLRTLSVDWAVTKLLS